MTPMVSLEAARAYLRLDSTYEDGLVSSLLITAEAICRDVARLSMEEWEGLWNADEDDGQPVFLHSESFPASEAVQYRKLLEVAVLYAAGYLFEHREEADHHDLTLTLRSLLFAIREGVV